MLVEQPHGDTSDATQVAEWAKLDASSASLAGAGVSYGSTVRVDLSYRIHVHNVTRKRDCVVDVHGSDPLWEVKLRLQSSNDAVSTEYLVRATVSAHLCGVRHVVWILRLVSV